MKYLTTVLFALTLAACGAPVNTGEGDAGAPDADSGPQRSHCSEEGGALCIDFSETGLTANQAASYCGATRPRSTGGSRGRGRMAPGACPTVNRVGSCYFGPEAGSKEGTRVWIYAPAYTSLTAPEVCEGLGTFVPN